MDKRRSYDDLGDLELDADVAAMVEAATDQAERDVEQRRADRQEVRVNFRWGARQLDVVQQAADLAGVPYQSYLKQVVFRQAMEDLRTARATTEPEYGDDRTPPRPLQLVTRQSQGR